MKNAEQSLDTKFTVSKESVPVGSWALQLDSQLVREPLLANASPYEAHMLPPDKDHPVDYPVADFGLAYETRYTLNNIKKAEKKLKHKLNFMNDPDPYYRKLNTTFESVVF